MAFELNFFKGRFYETSNTQDVRNQHNEEAKAVDEIEEDKEVQFLLVTHVNNILHSTFSNAEVFINIRQIYISNGLSAHES